MLMIKKNGQLIPVGVTNLVGGPQPTLFAPTVTGGTNEISWANNTNNGGFDVTITADVDGTPVTSPLTITQEMDGKTLTVRASAEYFTDAVSTLVLSYISPNQQIVSINKTANTGILIKAYGSAISFKSGAVDGGQTLLVWDNVTGNQTFDQAVTLKNTLSYGANIGMAVYSCESLQSRQLVSNYSSTYGTFSCTGTVTIKNKTKNLEAVLTASNSYRLNGNIVDQWDAGDELQIMINITG